MASPPLSDDELRRTLNAVASHSKHAEACAELGISASTLTRHLRAAKDRRLSTDVTPPIPPLDFPQFPDDDVPVEQIVDFMSKRFEKRKASYDAHTWFPVKVRDDKPAGILWFGDPHVDDNGCNWPVLQKHVDLCKSTEGLYGANIGDTTNNWSGRLVKLYANQDTSLKTARKLAQWFMLDSGVTWLVWLLGNHDQWGDGAAVLAMMGKKGTQKITCHDWEARFKLTFPNGYEARIWASHDFKGHSMWNPMHGPLRASKMQQDADLLVCGHKHNWGVMTWENADRGLFPTLIRVRGYKFLDEYARNLGIIEQEEGCSILTVIDPDASQRSSHIQTFTDVEQGAEYLTWLRARST